MRPSGVRTTPVHNKPLAIKITVCSLYGQIWCETTQMKIGQNIMGISGAFPALILLFSPGREENNLSSHRSFFRIKKVYRDIDIVNGRGLQFRRLHKTDRPLEIMLKHNA